MKREVVITADGSSTIHLADWDEQYHSKHGAIQEAYHVFITHGLRYFVSKKASFLEINSDSYQNDIKNLKKEISILEIGFGTGLNAFITLLESETLKQPINYVGVEGYPVVLNEIKQLNYVETLKAEKYESFFHDIHNTSWGKRHVVSNSFLLTKQNKFFSEINDTNIFNIIYFDAFGARVQPELWTESMFLKMYNALKPEGIIVTYAAKGSVRRAMQAVGFLVERLPGPPGKREMLRGTK